MITKSNNLKVNIMKTLVAKIGNDSVRNSMNIYYSEINGRSVWSVQNYLGEETHSLLESFDQAVKYACESLGFINYIR